MMLPRESPSAYAEEVPRQPDPDKDEPVSLAPLDYEEALRALLAVDPKSEPVSGQDAELQIWQGGQRLPSDRSDEADKQHKDNEP
jgi:hypothetical protein